MIVLCGEAGNNNMPQDIHVPGLYNLGHTCFFNAMLQALASSDTILAYLRRAVSHAGPTASTQTVTLLECLTDLAPGPHRTVSPGPVLQELRQHVHDPEALEDNTESDSIEALELLMGVVVAQQRKAFLAAVPQHAAQDAWQALQRAALNHSSTFNGACWPEEVGPNTAQLHGALPRDDRSQSLVDPADPGPVEDNSTQDTARLAAEQKPHLHREVLHAWQSLSRVPLEGTVLEELACARCGGLSRSHAAPVLALLLNLPVMQGRSGVSHVREGASVEQALKAHFTREVIQDVTCSRCSLKATLQQQEAAADIDASSPELQRLRSLVHARCSLPDCDFEELATAAGLIWRPQRTPLVKRSSIARPPEVLVLQLRRTVWSTRAGRLAKLSGRVSFPQLLNLQPYLSAAAEPLLPPVPALLSVPPTAPASSAVPSGLWGALGSPCPSTASLANARPPAAEQQHSTPAEPESGPQPSASTSAHATANARQPAGLAGDSAANGDSCKAGRDHAESASLPDCSRCLYRLLAVGVHRGKVAESGHYFAYRRVIRTVGGACAGSDRHCAGECGEGRCIEHARPVEQGSEVCEGEYWVCAMDEDVQRVELDEVLACPDASFLLYQRL